MDAKELREKELKILKEYILWCKENKQTPDAELIIDRLLSELASQQPTEKELYKKYRSAVKQMLREKSGESYTDKLAYLDELLNHTELLQSDSVDAEPKPFLEFIAKERDSFVTEFLSVPTTTKRRVMAENLLIAYDQMKERLAGLSSKVKPVNEKMREALKQVSERWNKSIEKGFVCNDEDIKILKVVNEALSSPDDGWIPVEKELPKNESNVLCYHIDSGNSFVCHYTKDCITNKPKWFGGAKPTHWKHITPPKQ